MIVIFMIWSSWASHAYLSPQAPDYIIFGQDTIPTYNLLLSDHLGQLDSSRTAPFFEDVQGKGVPTGCWRGYQAIYQVESDSLFLADIIDCFERDTHGIDKSQSLGRMRSIFGDKLRNDRVFMDWFDGIINFPLSDNLIRWDGFFYAIFERERVLSISNGLVRHMRDHDNYLQDPNRINRMRQDMVHESLFGALRKAKWKNRNGFDCSESYVVTIGEDGRITGVRNHASDDVPFMDQSDEEYLFCTTTMYNGLKHLRFDIIKDKGKPIAEDIYLKIWMDDDGTISNETW